MARRKDSRAALYQTMERLFSGDLQSADEMPSIDDLVRFSDVSRATAYRHGEFMRDWRERLAAAQVSAPHQIEVPPPKRRGGRKPESAKELRATIKLLANHIQVLALCVEELNQDLARARAAAAVRVDAR